MTNTNQNKEFYTSLTAIIPQVKELQPLVLTNINLTETTTENYGLALGSFRFQSKKSPFVVNRNMYAGDVKDFFELKYGTPTTLLGEFIRNLRCEFFESLRSIVVSKFNYPQRHDIDAILFNYADDVEYRFTCNHVNKEATITHKAIVAMDYSCNREFLETSNEECISYLKQVIVPR